MMGMRSIEKVEELQRYIKHLEETNDNKSKSIQFQEEKLIILAKELTDRYSDRSVWLAFATAAISAGDMGDNDDIEDIANEMLEVFKQKFADD